VAENEGGIVTYIPEPGFSGLDTLFYRVCATSNDAYCDSARLVVLVEQASLIQGIVEPVRFNLYPNPNQGEFILHSSERNTKTNRIEVFTISGNRIFSIEMEVHPGPNRISLPETLDKGIYILRVTHPGFHHRLKLLIQ
jgi:hypothetical protein